jgi:hypothetical protein
MRTSFHHQPEAQHPNFQLSISWQADYPIFWGEADMPRLPVTYRSGANDPKRTSGHWFCLKLFAKRLENYRQYEAVV